MSEMMTPAAPSTCPIALIISQFMAVILATVKKWPTPKLDLAADEVLDPEIQCAQESLDARRSTSNIQRPAKWARGPAASPSTNHLSLVTREAGEGVVDKHRTAIPKKRPTPNIQQSRLELGCVSGVDSHGRTIFVAEAHRREIGKCIRAGGNDTLVP